MEAFEYARPATNEEAVKLLADQWGQSEVLAGGTDLLDRMKDFVSSPKRVVSLRAIKDLKGLRFSPSTGLRVGASVTLEELAQSAVVRRDYAALSQAAETIAGPQTRNMGTVGGNLCQRPRCWYYRAGFGLLAQDKGKSLVPDGDNRYHAILGNSGPAYFVSPSSLAPVLIAFGAKLRLFGPDGNREVPVSKFFLTPQSDKDREQDIKPNEIITEVLIPPAGGVKSAFYEVKQKESIDWPLALAVVSLSMEGKTVKKASVVLGQVAPVPWPSEEAAQELEGKEISDAVAAAAGKAAASKATPLSMNRYKVQLASVAVKRAILRAAHGEV